MVVPAEVAATLRDLRLVDTAGERLMSRAHLADDADSAVLVTGEYDLEELLGLLREANHEKDRSPPEAARPSLAALKDIIDQL